MYSEGIVLKQEFEKKQVNDFIKVLLINKYYKINEVQNSFSISNIKNLMKKQIKLDYLQYMRQNTSGTFLSNYPQLP